MNKIARKLAYIAFFALAVASTAVAGTQLDAGKSASPSRHVTHAGNGGG